MSGTGKRAGIYARVSTRDKGQSPEMQLQCLRDFAKHRDLMVAEEFIDCGVSGAKDSRPQLNKLMDAARKRKLDVVLVYRFDRFARSVKHLVTALEEFNGLGIEFVSYSENIDTGTPLGRALFVVAGALGEMERSVLLERSMEGQRRARERGKIIGRPRAEFDTARVLELRKQGKSLREIGLEVGVSKPVLSRFLTRSESPPLPEVA